MALDPDNIRAFANGQVYVWSIPRLGTPTYPASIDASIPGGWDSVGYNSEDGAQFSFSREVVEKYAWQGEDPVRLLITRKPKSVKFGVMEFSPVGVGLACGGIYVTQDAARAYRIHPERQDYIDYVAVLIDAVDDDEHKYRFGYRKCLNQSNVEFSTVRNDTTTLPIELKVLAADEPGEAGAEPWFIQTNDEVWSDMVGDPS